MTPEQIRAERTMVEYELAISKGIPEAKAVRERIVSALTALYTSQNAANAEILQLQDEVNELVKMLRVLNEETVLAGFPGGDRNQTLANVREMRTKLLATAGAIKEQQ